MVTQVPPAVFGEFREFLQKRGFTFESRPHQVFLARAPGASVSLYENGKVLVTGSDQVLLREIDFFISEVGEKAIDKRAWSAQEEFSGTRVGIDEAGKGDYFGPLVVAAAMVTEFQVGKLRAAGVKDSKALDSSSIQSIASKIKNDVLFRGQWRIVKIPPVRYNILHHKMKNVNKILGWAHARALEDVLQYPEPCLLAISDEFGDRRYIEDSLFSKGRRVELVTTPKGERDPAVAAASILARDGFLQAMADLSRTYKREFPRGASNVEEFARGLVAAEGPEVLLDVAKIHFATTNRVVADSAPLKREIANRAKVDRELGAV